MVNIEDKTPEEIAEILATASPSDRTEVFIQSLEKHGLVREALKALVLAIDRADASVNDAIERGDLSDTDEWFYSGMQTATDGANDFMQYVLKWGVAPEVDAWT